MFRVKTSEAGRRGQNCQGFAGGSVREAGGGFKLVAGVMAGKTQNCLRRRSGMATAGTESWVRRQTMEEYGAALSFLPFSGIVRRPLFAGQE